MFVYLKKLFSISLIGVLSSCGADPDISTLSEESIRLYERLTYPQSEWAADDFGEEASVKELDLCERFKPTFLVAPGGFIPIDFYKEYLPNSSIYNADGMVVYDRPSRYQLKKTERSLGYYVDVDNHIEWNRANSDRIYNSKIYCTIHKETLTPFSHSIGKYETAVWLIAYRSVFPQSGLPNLNKVKNVAAEIVGDTESWHELDIHGAVFFIIHQKKEIPLALMLAQHNHFRSYIFGFDIDHFAKSRLCISYALGSNEPYICPDADIKQVVSYPTSGDPSKLRYIFQNQGIPISSGLDNVWGIGSGAIALNLELEILPKKDPLLTSWIPLGEPKKLIGVVNSISRTGPPGMLINTWPGLSSMSKTAQLFYIRIGDEVAFKIFEDAYSKGDDWTEKLLKYNSRHFWSRLIYAHQWLEDYQ